jgi:hypothetical protein
MKGDFARIHSKTMQDDVMKVLKDNYLEVGNRREPVWVGLNRNSTTNETINWEWVDGMALN